MEDLVFLVVGLLLITAGVFHRRNLFRAYEGDRKRDTGTTPMKIVHIEKVHHDHLGGAGGRHPPGGLHHRPSAHL